MSEMELTEEQKQIILKEFANTPDLRELTRKVYNNTEIDGRSWQGRLVRAFLTQQNLNSNSSAFSTKEVL